MAGFMRGWRRGTNSGTVVDKYDDQSLPLSNLLRAADPQRAAQLAAEQRIKRLRQTLAKHPDKAKAWLALAQTLLNLRRADEALAAWERCIALVPEAARMERPEPIGAEGQRECEAWCASTPGSFLRPVPISCARRGTTGATGGTPRLRPRR